MRSRLLNKRADSFSGLTLEQALHHENQYEAMKAWIKTNNTDSHVESFTNEITDTTTNNADEYQEFINKHAVQLAHDFGQDPLHLPYPLCGSVLSWYTSVTLPTDFVSNLCLGQIIDEYFGICYHRERVVERFDDDILDVIEVKIKEKVSGVEEMLEYCIQHDVPSIAVTDVDSLICLYGRSAVKLWWRTMTREDLKEWENRYADFMGAYSLFSGDDAMTTTLIERFGELPN